MRQELAYEVDKALGSDMLLTAFKDAKDAKMRNIVAGACVQFMKHWDSADKALLQKPLLDNYGQFATFCRCVAELFLVPGISCSAKDVSFFADYAGPSAFARSIKTALRPRADEKADKKLTESEKVNRQFLADVLADCLRTAGTAPALQPSFEKALSIMDNAQSASLEELQFVFAKLPEFKSGLRKGKSNPLEARLAKVIMTQANSLMDDPANSNVTTTKLQFMATVLNKFANQPGCLDTHAKLTEWSTAYAGKVAQQDVFEWACAFVEGRKKSERTGAEYAGPPVDAATLTASLRKCGTTVSDKLRPELMSATYFLLRDFLVEV